MPPNRMACAPTIHLPASAIASSSLTPRSRREGRLHRCPCRPATPKGRQQSQAPTHLSASAVASSTRTVRSSAGRSLLLPTWQERGARRGRKRTSGKATGVGRAGSRCAALVECRSCCLPTVGRDTGSCHKGGMQTARCQGTQAPSEQAALAASAHTSTSTGTAAEPALRRSSATQCCARRKLRSLRQGPVRTGEQR